MTQNLMKIFLLSNSQLPDGVIRDHSDRLRQSFLAFASPASPQSQEAGDDDVDGLMNYSQWMDFISKSGVLGDGGLKGRK